MIFALGIQFFLIFAGFYVSFGDLPTYLVTYVKLHSGLVLLQHFELFLYQMLRSARVYSIAYLFYSLKSTIITTDPRVNFRRISCE